jgi:hypothetical protein
MVIHHDYVVLNSYLGTVKSDACLSACFTPAQDRLYVLGILQSKARE